MADPHALIERYVANELTQEEWAALSQWLSVKDSNRQLFLAQVDFYRVVRGVLVEEQRELAKQAEASGSSMFDAETLKTLLEIQAAAEDTPLVRLEPKKKVKTPSEPMARLTPRMVIELIPNRYIYRSLAAAVLLAIALITLIQIVGSDESPPIAHDLQPDATSPGFVLPNKPIVATLTAQQNATWAEGASSPGSLIPGSKLHPNTRLTLTAGFAEITTKNGAIAILEAPATIELLDNDNALRLHSGKLVGICETESSKGFLVRTPHMDVTDLGTEFGVQVSRNNVTATVIIGEVTVTPTGGLPQRLTANQTAQLKVAGSNRELVLEDQLAAGFDALREQLANRNTQLPGSGEGLAVGAIAPNWRITAIDGQTLDSPLSLRVVDLFEDQQPDPLLPARMLWHLPEIRNKDAIYRIETTLRLPDGFDPDREQVVMRYRVDNTLLSMTADGRSVPVHEPKVIASTQDFNSINLITITTPFKPGNNHLVFEVKNAGPNSPENPVGMQVAWELQPVATKQPVQTP